MYSFLAAIFFIGGLTCSWCLRDDCGYSGLRALDPQGHDHTRRNLSWHPKY
jgi:hypothetical protein